jgi:hypothetical protein
VVLDRHGLARQLPDLVLVEDELGAQRLGHGEVARAAAASLVVHHRDLLGAQAAGDLGPGRLEDEVLVRIHHALDDVLAQAVDAGDEDDLVEARLRVEGEDDARAGQVRADHLLDANREVDLLVVEAALGPIDDGAVREQRCEAAPAGLDQRRHAVHVQVGLLLAGKACLGQVLRGRARAHGDVGLGLARLAGQVGVCARHLVEERFGERGLADHLAALGRAGAQLADVVGVDRGQRLDHLAEGRVLAPRDGDVVQGQRVEGPHILHDGSALLS